MGFRHTTLRKSHFYQYYVVGRFLPPKANAPIPGFIILRDAPKAARELVEGVRERSEGPNSTTRGGVLGGEGVGEGIGKSWREAGSEKGSAMKGIIGILGGEGVGEGSGKSWRETLP